MPRQSCAFVISLLMTFPCLGASIDSVVLDRDPVPEYDRLELKVLIESTYTNPFDPIEIDLWGEFIPPSGAPKKISGFRDGENWKIRFAGGEKDHGTIPST